MRENYVSGAKRNVANLPPDDRTADNPPEDGRMRYFFVTQMRTRLPISGAFLMFRRNESCFDVEEAVADTIARIRLD
jgi:hypothetical protein